MDSQPARVIQISSMSLNQTRNQSKGHYQPSHTEAPCFEWSLAFWAGLQGAEPVGALADSYNWLRFFPQRAPLWCVSPWRAQCWIPVHGWKSERGIEERKTERRDPCSHRPDLRSVPVFRADLEGNNNQGHSGKWMQHRFPPGKTHQLYFFD